MRPLRAARALLTFDSIGGLVAGCWAIVAASLLTVWYSWPAGLSTVFGWVNVSYGCYSGALALRLRQKGQLARGPVVLLVVANGAWALVCFGYAWSLRGSVSYLGLGHFLVEGVWLAALALLEVRYVLPVVAGAS